MELKELENLIKSRRSIRAWQDKPVPRELLSKAIELATWAPNGGNNQNWCFYAITDRTKIQAIADAVQASAQRITTWSEAAQFGSTATAWRDRAGFFRTAPAAIAVAASQYQSVADQILAARQKQDAEAARMREWRHLADSRIQSVSAAVAYLILVLHQMGLGTTWMTGPIQAKGEIEKILGVPAGMDIVTFVPVGYPAEAPPSKGRRPVSEVAVFI